MPDIIRTMCVASASELIQQSDLYMTVKAVLFTTPSPNLNGVRCTERFIDEIVANQDAYVGLPLNADIRSLESGQYNKLGHMYDQTTGTFATAIIGSFYKFEKAVLPNGDTALIGYARIMKRNKAVCTAVGELFASGNLKFSFEISCGEYSTLEDGTMLIDASKENFLEGMCIVWSPACPDAVAKELVAELTNDRKEAEDMHENSAEVTAEVDEKVDEVVTENTDVAAEETTEDVSQAECKCDDEEEHMEEAQAKDKEKCAENTEDAEKETASVEEVAESDTQPEEETAEAKTETAEEADVSSEDANTKDVAAETAKTMEQMFAELKETIDGLRAEIESLKTEKAEVIAETQVAQVNGFMDTIALPEKKYSLLEREEMSGSYTLLEKNY